MESHDAGFPPFPHSVEIPSGFPHSHGLNDWIYVFSCPLNSNYRHRKGLVTDVSGPQRNACPGTLRAACLALIGSATVAMAAGNQSGDLPEGKGKAAFERACVGCHQIELATGNRYAEAGWRRTVNTMVERGAELSEPETADVIAYLSKYFGKVNVNKADAAQLEDALGLTEIEARAIVSYREQNGDIKDLDLLKSVPGMSADKIQAKAAEIAFRD
jgi:competence protein ComEA